MPLGRVINRKSTELRENLASNKISPATFQYRFSSLNIVNTVVHHLLPIAFVNWLIPRQVQFHMMNAQIDLELLQSLFLRTEVPDIGIGQVVSLSERRVAVLLDDQLLAEREQPFVAVPQRCCVENMVVVSTIVEANQLKFE